MNFLYDSWYCAGFTKDLDGGTHAIKIMDQHIVLFRDEHGDPHAIADRCPHRFAPLSLGQVVNGVLECPYHGLQFDGQGRCVLNPHGSGTIPPQAKVAAYPVIERDTILWIWMGKPELADPAEIVDASFLSDDRFDNLYGHVPVAANYQLVNDNLLDLTHASYIHLNTVGVAREYSVGPERMHLANRVENGVVYAEYGFFDVPTTKQFEPVFKEEKGDVYVYVAWKPASSMILDLSISEVGTGKGDWRNPTENSAMLPTAHLVTPETKDSCHYFFAMGRNRERNNPAMDAQIAEFTRFTFQEEDAFMMERCYQRMDDDDLFALSPAILETDRSAVQARRILAKAIRAQDRGDGLNADELQVMAAE